VRGLNPVGIGAETSLGRDFERLAGHAAAVVWKPMVAASSVIETSGFVLVRPGGGGLGRNPVGVGAAGGSGFWDVRRMLWDAIPLGLEEGVGVFECGGAAIVVGAQFSVGQGWGGWI
jgi:hypothetical protein